MAHVVLLLALSASYVQAIRRISTSEEPALSESAASNDGESGVRQHTSVASNSTSVLGLYYTSMVEKPDNSTPAYTKKGICCKWDDRFGNEIYRYFYYMKKNKYGKEKYETPWACPGGVFKWSGADNYYCNGMPAYNKVGYKEDSDWVLCCNIDKKKVDYYYAGGEPCKSYGGGASINPLTNAQCTNKDCYEHNNVDANDIVCPATHPKKIVNEKADWACSKGRRGTGVNRPELYPNFTDMQCAGYDKNCALINCIKHSITKASKRDCSSWCDAEFAMGPGAYNGATQTGVYSFWIVLFIAAGTLSPTSA